MFLNGMVMATCGDSMPGKQPAKWNEWMVVNDGVMGGISQSRVEVTSRDTMLFIGHVSLENNGGFASIRHNVEPFDVRRGAGILLRVRGDGKNYQLRLRTSDRFDGMAYKADFKTRHGEWQEFRLPWNVFTATFRGRTIKGAPVLQPQNIRQVGFLIADNQEGAFQLEIESLASF